MSQVKVKINRGWSNDELSRLDKGIFAATLDVDARSKILAPKLHGHLRNSSRVRRVRDLAYAITFGSSKVPYARRQYYEHKSKSEWMARAADSVLRGNLRKYFR